MSEFRWWEFWWRSLGGVLLSKGSQSPGRWRGRVKEEEEEAEGEEKEEKEEKEGNS